MSNTAKNITKEPVLLMNTQRVIRGRKVNLRMSDGTEQTTVVDNLHGSMYDGAKLVAIKENGKIIGLATRSQRAYRLAGKYKGFEKTPQMWPIMMLAATLVSFSGVFFVLEMYARTLELQLTFTPMLLTIALIVALIPLGRKLYRGYRNTLLARLELPANAEA